MYLNFKKILFLILISSFVFFVGKPIIADDLQNQIDQITKQISDLEAAIAPLKNETVDLKKKISTAKTQIVSIESSVSKLNQNLAQKESELENQKELLGERVKRYYINTKKFNPLMIFLSSGEGSSLLQQYTWYQSIIGKDKETIVQYTSDISSLNTNKTKLETQKNNLAKLKNNLESRFGFLSQEITKAEDDKKRLYGLLKQLEEQRIAGLGLPTTTGSGISCIDDRTVDPGFGTGFAFFTFGIPHHVGLNQYGAYGRANAGQSYDQILKAYYNFDEYQDRGSVTIKVNNGNGINQGSVIWTGSLEDYVKRIYEVPASWPIESLKAQAIAARSYALAVTNNGQNSICANQYCQVFKTSPKTEGQWQQAVNNTSGKVMVVGGQPITAWFASTAGGYTVTNNDIWGGEQKSWTKRLRDTNGDVNSLDDLKNKAYDKDSPCFYSAQGWRTNESGKKTAWLKPSEVADIVNAVLLGQKDSSTQKYLCSTDISGGRCKVGNEYYDVWSVDKVKEELKNKGEKVCNTVSSTSLSFDFNSGKTTQISFNCDTGTYPFDGSTFKTYFNSRAPANIAIVGPLYNVEKR